MPKNALFLLKNLKIIDRWGIRPQTPALAPPSYDEFLLATRLVSIMLKEDFYLSIVYRY